MADFKLSVAKTLVHEGGFQNSVTDWANWEGGAATMNQYLQTKDPSLLVNLKGTKYGITAQDLPGTDIESLSEDDAVQYYSEHYWKSLYSQIEDQDIADKLFDMGVLFGVGEAVKLLQITLQETFSSEVADGNFGPVTLSNVNQCGASSLLEAYKSTLVAYTLRIAAVKPLEKANVPGWGRRINS